MSHQGSSGNQPHLLPGSQYGLTTEALLPRSDQASENPSLTLPDPPPHGQGGAFDNIDLPVTAPPGGSLASLPVPAQAASMPQLEIPAQRGEGAAMPSMSAPPGFTAGSGLEGVGLAQATNALIQQRDLIQQRMRWGDMEVPAPHTPDTRNQMADTRPYPKEWDTPFMR